MAKPTQSQGKKTRNNKKASTKKPITLFSIIWFLVKWLVIFIFSGATAAAAIAAVAYAIAYPKLPDVHRLTEYQPAIPLRIYTADGILIGEYGDEKRTIVTINNFPDKLKDALLAVEDANFREHIGIDYKGLVRATLKQISNPRSQGASTITMQVARNFYLSSERTYIRKFYEMLLSLRIESSLTKDQILEIYMNQIFLGHRSYGFAEAAHTYYGKELNDLTIGECAMLAGLPQSPSKNNPLTNPKAARNRQLHVLERMRQTEAITQAEYEAAVAEPITLRRPTTRELHAEYAAAEAQLMILGQFPQAYTSGLNVYTTIQSPHQKAAYQALRNGLISYERGQFYRGPEGKITLPSSPNDLAKAVAAARQDFPDNGTLLSAVVLSADPKKVVLTRDGINQITLTGKSIEPVQSGLKVDARNGIKIAPGSIVRIVSEGEDKWYITQIPQVEGALVALDPNTGAIRALVGGFDFTYNKFNHATQAWRQSGSVFKPFVFSAALERGITANTTLNDAPISVTVNGRMPWMPTNYGGRFAGPVPLHEALARSRNIPAILVIDAISPNYAKNWVTSRFGFDPEKTPENLTMVLGTGSTTPLQITSAYGVFANGGHQVAPHLITHITDSQDNTLYEHKPVVLNDSTRAISARNAFVMNTLLRQVLTHGSGGSAQRALKRRDIYGKTGTTNKSHDAWFVGYTPSLVTGVWVGYDTPKDLGRNENGGRRALPIWVDYMKFALKDQPQATLRPVPGVSNERGQWVYDEYTGFGGIQSIGDELTPQTQEVPEIDTSDQGDILNMFLD